MHGKTTDTVAFQKAVSQIPSLNKRLARDKRITSRLGKKVKWNVGVQVMNGGEDFAHVATRVDKTMAFCVGAHETTIEHLTDDPKELITCILLLEEDERGERTLFDQLNKQ